MKDKNEDKLAKQLLRKTNPGNAGI